MPDTPEPALEAALAPLTKRLETTATAVDLLDSGSRYTMSMRRATKAILLEAAEALSASPQAEIDRLRDALRESIRQLDVIIEDGIPTDFRMWRDDLKTALHPGANHFNSAVSLAHR